MSVQLGHATVADVTGLPFPAHGQAVETVSNQSVHRSASGQLYTAKHAPTKYRITRSFEGLTDAQARQVADFWEAVGQAGGDITYQYSPHGASAKSIPCRIVEPPATERVMRDFYVVTLVFEQDTHPDRDSDPG